MAMARMIANAMKEINGAMTSRMSDSTLEWSEGAVTVSASWYGHRPIPGGGSSRSENRFVTWIRFSPGLTI